MSHLFPSVSVAGHTGEALYNYSQRVSPSFMVNNFMQLTDRFELATAAAK